MDISTPSDDGLGADESLPPKSKTKTMPSQSSGALSRHLFTGSVILGIIVAAYAFLWLLGRSTEDVGQILNLPQRSTEQIYRDAEATQQKYLRLRALQNFTAAYPESENIAKAQTSIEALRADEYQGWLTLSDVFYSARTRPSAKLEALELYASEWGGGSYKSEINIMRAKLTDAPVISQRKRAQDAPGLSETSPMSPAAKLDLELAEIDSLAGAAPQIEIFKPAVTLPVPPSAEPEPIIVEAAILKDKKPKYPSRALARGITATVTISMDITAEGKVKNTSIVQAATGRYAREFGISALRAAKRTRFKPRTVDGVAMPTNGYTRKYTFEINE